jgi:hypothetical protein
VQVWTKNGAFPGVSGSGAWQQHAIVDDAEYLDDVVGGDPIDQEMSRPSHA